MARHALLVTLLGPIPLGIAAAFIGSPEPGALGEGAFFAGMGIALALLAQGAGALTLRDPRRGWAPSAETIGLVLAFVAFLAVVVDLRLFLAAPASIRAGYLAGRGEPRSAEWLLAATLACIALAIGLDPPAWDDGPLWLVPALLGATSFAIREAADLVALAAATTTPGSRRAALRAWLATAAWLGAGIALVLAFGLWREPLRASLAGIDGDTARWFALGIAAASLGGLGWLAARAATRT